MRILLVHNNYGRYSGEEAVVDRQAAAFAAGGHQVRQLRLTSEGARGTLLGNIRGFFAGMYSFRGVRLMRRALREFRPDEVHVHNLYPFLSPACLFPCRRAGARVVMTVHNYRLVCPTGLFLREGRACEECLAKGNELPCVKHNCEGSRLRSLGYALRNAVARLSGAYLRNVHEYRCLTAFQKRKLVEAGFPEERIVVQPQPSVPSKPQKLKTSKPETFVAYVGRLSYEKGYDLLVEFARRHPEIPVKFAGEAREEALCPELPNVEYCGLLSKPELEEFYERAALLVIPSRCYEGYPMVIPEALAHGLPILAPNHGPFPDLIPGKTLFAPGDAADLERGILALWSALPLPIPN